MSNEEYKKLQATLDKPWAEATVEEKLEKIRQELIQLGYLSNRANANDMEIAKLKKHSHQDGKLVIPLDDMQLNNVLSGAMLASRRNNLS